MPTSDSNSGFVSVDKARIYYETAGSGMPFVMIHAGVADSRQWNNEFSFFAKDYRVVRYDMRGYGRSEPVDGSFSHIRDLTPVLEALDLHEPLILMGCSMGGGLAMDFALMHPARVRALIMVDAGPSGLKLDVPAPPKLAEAEKAFDAGDLDRTAELETQVWFDGMNRSPEQVDQAMRRLVYEMDRTALAHEARQLGKRRPNTKSPAFNRLAELHMPVLVIVGAQDTPYMLAAADYMVQRISSVQKAVIEDAAHLPNLDKPEEFRALVSSFLGNLPS